MDGNVGRKWEEMKKGNGDQHVSYEENIFNFKKWKKRLLQTPRKARPAKVQGKRTKMGLLLSGGCS